MIGKKKVDVVRIALVKENTVLYGDTDNNKVRIENPEEAVKMAASLFNGADRELVYVCALDAKMLPINISLVAMGGMAACEIHIPEIFKAAILANCPNIICFHNHPSGNIDFSEEDRKMTYRLERAGKLLGIKLQDHIIIGDNGQYFSFQKEGLLTNGDWGLTNEEKLAC